MSMSMAGKQRGGSRPAAGEVSSRRSAAGERQL